MKRSGGYRYVVTLKNKSDLDDFYSEMESSNGTENIPNRKVQCLLKRPLSRSTHYQLTDEEASKLKNDDRVLCVDEPYHNKGIKSKLCWDEPQNANWDKIPDTDNDKNWALKRCIDGQQTPNWGTDGTVETITGSVNTTSSGKNVDIIIVDSHIDPNHSEFSDGNGGSRVNQIDWFALYRTIVDPDDELNIPNNYSYSNMSQADHGTHVAGIAAGNTSGWARDANIYNIAFNNTTTNGNFSFDVWSAILYDFIKAFHENKSINPATGRKNPTIVNGSYSFFIGPIYLYHFISSTNQTEMVQIWRYRGTAGFFMGDSDERKETLEQKRVPVRGNDEKGNYIPEPSARVDEVENDIKDLIDTGVIIVASAGNDSFSIDVEGGDDYDNAIWYDKLNQQGVIQNYIYFTNRGASPGAAEGVICVGSVGTKVAEYKSDFSNFDKRVDIWAPGGNIISASYGPNPPWSIMNGTSMASPQVAGLLACLAEQWPTMNQADALQFLKEGSESQVGNNLPADKTVTESPYEAFGDSNNRYVRYVYKRPQTGTVYPHPNYANRNENTSGVKYPRSRYTVTK